MKNISNNSIATPRSEFIAGIKATFPLVVGAIPFGIIFGALAVTSGLSPTGTIAMSVFVFAGASQFIAAGLIASGTGIFVIIATTFIVNLRHILYAATLGPHVKNLSQKWLLPLGFWLTDETFVVTIQRYQDKESSNYKHWFFFGSSIFMYLNWILCTFIGLKAGQQIEDPASWGLDFAMIVTFIGMLIPMIKSRSMLASVIFAGFSAILFDGLPHQLGLFLAAIIGITAGLLINNIWPDQKMEIIRE